jgi:hypothetical protein
VNVGRTSTQTITVAADDTPWSCAFQLVHTSRGHLLWFRKDRASAARRLVRCPEHRFTSVRDTRPVHTVPLDALRGSTITDSIGAGDGTSGVSDGPPAAFRPVPAGRPDCTTIRTAPSLKS